MKYLDNNELMNIEGGSYLTASFLNAASRALSTLMDIGRSFGTSLRRIFSGSVCSL